MISRAISKYNRISPKKARLLTRPLRAMAVKEAYAFLNNTNKKVSRLIYKVVKSAVHNALRKDSTIKEIDLYISKVVADSGPVLKRFRAASMGRAAMIRKPTSHLTVELDVRQRSETKVKDKTGVVKKRSIFRKKTADSIKKKGSPKAHRAGKKAHHSAKK